MRRRGWWIAVVIVLLTNLIILLGLARNRAGEPEAVVELTERELPIVQHRDEETGMSLRLEHGDLRSLDWLDRSKLEDLGFDCSAPPNAAEAEFHYGKQLPRRGFLVLENGGEPWLDWLEEQREQLEQTEQKVARGEADGSVLESNRESFETERLTRSRLFAVDAGDDPDVLRQRHPERDRLLILPAVFRIAVETPWNSEAERSGTPRLRGHARLLVREIHLPRDLADPLEPFRRDPAPWSSADPFVAPRKFDPRYTVTLEVGSRHEPWIARVQRQSRPGQ